MTKRGVEAVTADSQEALALGESLTSEEWMADSDCAGWSVKDVFAHLSSVFRQVADPTSAVEGATDDTEANQELYVALRKGVGAGSGAR
jgi:ribonuclease I